jgi:UV DNA damage endonuclease
MSLLPLQTRKYKKQVWIVRHEENEPNVRFGLCCINNYLRDKDIFCSRTTPRRTFTVEKAKKLASKNLEDVMKIMKWNNEFGIHHYRLSSDMFPHINDKQTDPYELDIFKVKLK